MATMYDDVDAKCPFFQFSGNRRITCEGIMGSSMTIVEFRNKDKRNQHRRKFCDAKYQNCEICKMLEKKYEKG